MVLTGTLYPSWGPILYALVPNAYDSIPIRLALGGSLAITVGLSYYFKWFQKNIANITYFVFALAYIHVYQLILKNDFHIAYAFGGFITIIIESICFIHLRALAYYCLVVTATVIVGTVLNPQINSIMYGVASLTLLPVCYVSVRNFVKMMQQLQKSKEELLDLSAAVQTLFLPADKSFKSDFYEVNGYYRAVDKCGGDWWKYTKTSDQNLRITVGDVMGHGPGSAMMTASVASYFRVLESQSQIGSSEILNKVNEQMTDFGKSQSSYLMTMLSLDFDFKTGILKAHFAGCPAPAIVKANGEVHYPMQAGTPLGSLDFQLGSVEYSLAEGDRVLIYTDGIVEAEKDKNQFGQRRLNKLIKDTRSLQPESALSKIIDSIDQFVGDFPQGDDYTMIVLDVKKISNRNQIKAS